MQRSALMTGLPLSLTFGVTSAWAGGDGTGDAVKLSWNAVRSIISSLYSAIANLF
jgi:hypothetical protein